MKMPSSYPGGQGTPWEHMLILKMPMSPPKFINLRWCYHMARSECHPTPWHARSHSSMQNRGQRDSRRSTPSTLREGGVRSDPHLPLPFHKTAHRPANLPAKPRSGAPPAGGDLPVETFPLLPLSSADSGSVSGPIQVSGDFCKKKKGAYHGLKRPSPTRLIFTAAPRRRQYSVQVKNCFTEKDIKSVQGHSPKVVE